MRNIIGTCRAPKGHWLGDGFPSSEGAILLFVIIKLVFFHRN